MGIILLEMCSLFKTGMDRRMNIELLRNEHKLSENLKQDYPSESALIYWMTHPNPSERPTAREILDSDSYNNWRKQVTRE